MWLALILNGKVSSAERWAWVDYIMARRNELDSELHHLQGRRTTEL